MTTQTPHKLTRDTIEIPYRHVTTHFIDGAWREGQGLDTIEVTDPATNTVWARRPSGPKTTSSHPPSLRYRERRPHTASMTKFVNRRTMVAWQR